MDFREVMSTATTICNHYSNFKEDDGCKLCPLYKLSTENDCPFYCDFQNQTQIVWENVETTVDEWLTDRIENLPTWEEWQMGTFSGFAHIIKPCMFTDIACADAENGDCLKCAKQKIPYSIAVKLGIFQKLL